MALFASRGDVDEKFGERNRGITWDNNTYPVVMDADRIYDVRIQVSRKLAKFVLAIYPETRDGNLCSFLENNTSLWGEFWASEAGQELRSDLVEKWGEDWSRGFREDQLPRCIDFANKENNIIA